MNRTATIIASCAFVLALGAGIAISRHAQMLYGSPQRAVDELVSSIRTDDVQELQVILGSQGYDVLHSGDDVADRDARRRFLAAYQTRSQLVTDGPGRAILQVGADAWRFPIPLVKGPDGWYFDTAAGRDELRARRIGRNELATIGASKAYVDAQREYAKLDRGNPIRDYAQRFVSTQGNRDGLYWTAKPGEPASPLGRLVSAAEARGYAVSANASPQPFNGYYFQILKAQGWSARGGAYNYVAQGKMIGGFALLAYPARYRVSGIMTFIVNQDGVVFQKDLGPKTDSIAPSIEAFDPGPGWTKV